MERESTGLELEPTLLDTRGFRAARLEAQALADSSGLAQTIGTACDYVGRFYEYRYALGFRDAVRAGTLPDCEPLLTVLPRYWFGELEASEN